MTDATDAEEPTLILVHCTTVERGRLIAVQGLLPGSAERCNYDAGRWMPLDGVYLSQSAAQIAGYRRAHGLQAYALVVVEAHPDDLLPDEDVVEVLLGTALQSIGGRPWGEMLEDGAGEMPPAGHAFWPNLRDAFVRLAGEKSASPLRPADLDDLVDWWATYVFEDEDMGEVDPWEWAALKDRIVRAFPRMEGMALHERSKRHPGPIGFEGRTRIVAVVEVGGQGEAKVIAGTLPRDVPLVDEIGDADRWGA